MSGTRAGGVKAAAKNLAKNPNFYKELGSKGGRLGHTGSFAANHELARTAGTKGGRTSRRTGIKNGFGKPRVKAPIVDLLFDSPVKSPLAALWDKLRG